MNDFTKEELQEIVDMTNDIDKGSQSHGLRMHFNIRDKAQSMIDNYCDHEEKEVIQTVLQGTTFTNQCKKCKRIV